MQLSLCDWLKVHLPQIFQQIFYLQKINQTIKYNIQMSQLNPSWKTICALINSMIGGAMLTLPILFREAGLGVGILILLASGWISYKTCSIYVMHMSQKQTQIQETINRLLGRKYENFFKLITGIYLVFLNIIYIDLIVDQGFNILYFIFHKTGHSDWITKKNQKQIVFNKMSVQIVALISFVPLLLTMFIKNLSFLLSLASLGVITVFAYCGFIFYKFFPAIGHIIPSTIPWFSWNFGNLAGTSAVAFTIHTVVNPIIKANLKQNHNLRDLKISYICGFLIYTSIGILGSLPIIGIDCKVTIINCYLQQYSALIVQILYFLMLLSVFPCFISVGRTRLLTYLFGAIQQKYFRIFNIGFMFLACLFAFLSPFLRLDLLINLVGAFLCFFFIYFIPIKFHLACLYKKKPNQSISPSTNQSQNNMKDSLLEGDQPLSQSVVSIGQKITCQHPSDYADSMPKQVRYAGLGFIMVVGVAAGAYGIYDFISQVIDSIKH